MFWHSHVSFQRGDGLFGPYIVRRPVGNDPNDYLYDFDLTEHFIFPQEWFHIVSSTQVFQCNSNIGFRKYLLNCVQCKEGTCTLILIFLAGL